MTVEIVKFKPEHLAFIDDLSVPETKVLPKEALDRLAAKEHSYSFLIDGVPLVCFGFLKLWEGRGEMWAFFDKDSNKYALSIIRHAVPVVENSPYKRLEMAVGYQHFAGRRLAEAMGFKVDAPFMEAYGRDGKDYVLYSRIRRD